MTHLIDYYTQSDRLEVRSSDGLVLKQYEKYLVDRGTEVVCKAAYVTINCTW